MLPWCVVPFAIGLNKLTIDMTFYLCILYYCFKNSNISTFVNFLEVCETHLKINEFKSEVSKIFGLMGKKYLQFSTGESKNFQIKEE